MRPDYVQGFREAFTISAHISKSKNIYAVSLFWLTFCLSLCILQLYDACVSMKLRFRDLGFSGYEMTDSVQLRAACCFLGVHKFGPSLAV